MAELVRDIQVGQVFRFPRPANGRNGRNRRNERFGDDEEMTYVFVKALGVLREHDKGWCREVNVVKWNGCQPKLDIRDWNEEHNRMGRGITLSLDEARTLKNMLMAYDLRDLAPPPAATATAQAPVQQPAYAQAQAPAPPPASAWAAVGL